MTEAEHAATLARIRARLLEMIESERPVPVYPSDVVITVLAVLIVGVAAFLVGRRSARR